MFSGNKTKGKLLAILKILQQYSDKEHPLTMPEIIKKLAEEPYAIKAERKSISRDLQNLREMGYDINEFYDIGEFAETKNRGYYLREQAFEVSELRLLADAVRCAKFLSEKDSAKLIEKLKTNLSIYQAKHLCKGICNTPKVKTTNKEVFYIVDIIDEAIQAKKKILFQYGCYDANGQFIPYSKDKNYIINPYGLVWSHDRYYLVGNYDTYENISHYRVDRIKNINILEETIKPPEKLPQFTRGFNFTNYIQKTVYMFGDEPQEKVELKFKNYMLEMVWEQFGRVETTKFDEEHFKIRITVGTQGLMYWLLQCGTNCEVLSPNSFRQVFKEELKTMLSAYE